MTHREELERRSEVLKRSIDQMTMKNNRRGLSAYENNVYQSMLKKLHHQEYTLNVARKQG